MTRETESFEKVGRRVLNGKWNEGIILQLLDLLESSNVRVNIRQLSSTLPTHRDRWCEMKWDKTIRLDRVHNKLFSYLTLLSKVKVQSTLKICSS